MEMDGYEGRKHRRRVWNSLSKAADPFIPKLFAVLNYLSTPQIYWDIWDIHVWN